MKKIKLKKEKKYSFCSCGLSKSLPFCDNKHRPYNEQQGTNYKSLKITPNTEVEITINSSNWHIK